MFSCCIEDAPVGDNAAEVQIVASTAFPEREPGLGASAEPKVEETPAASTKPVDNTTPADADAKVEPQPDAKAALVPPKSFQVTIIKESGDMGLAYYFHENHLLVAGGIGGSSGSPLDEWNKNQTELFQKVRIFDRILEINGVAGTKKELEARLKEQGQMTITFEHPRQLEVGLEKKGQPVGLSFSCTNGLTGAVITGVEDGLIKQFNTAAPADKRIKVNDIAVKLDSEQMKGEDLIKKIDELENFKVRLLSYSA
eukprot:TRINITY_DN33769_c0_g1_i1.p1 TRINITY_DN33769_c0_g1~~TRINITY_DN33769_c0_g1_i1.p1  ORF type:complete len:255 (+),score=73.78 TRINITY_DN33769_c0_g1_i1:56-820(+)